MSEAIVCRDLWKKYGDFAAVHDLDLHIEDGEIYGFLGPNGAGKTTTILMLMGIIRPTRGSIKLFGEEVDGRDPRARSRIGVVSEKQYLYGEMTMWEYLSFFADLYGVVEGKREKIERLAERVDLSDVMGRRLGAFSRGMQQKLGFIRAFLHGPEFLILDEPISGLDPIGIKQIRDLIEEEHRGGRTIFISSHLLSEVEKLCDRVGIINRGTLVAEGRMSELSRALSDTVEVDVELSEGKEEVYEGINNLEFVRTVEREGKRMKISVRSDRDYRREISQAIIGAGDVPVEVELKEMSLEEAFVTITKENISLLAKGVEEDEG